MNIMRYNLALRSLFYRGGHWGERFQNAAAAAAAAVRAGAAAARAGAAAVARRRGA
jgi:hypothetical protein